MKLATRLLGVLFLAVATLAGCHELGHIDGIGDYGGIGSGDVVGEIQYVDTRAREIEIRTDAGPTSVVRYACSEFLIGVTLFILARLTQLLDLIAFFP